MKSLRQPKNGYRYTIDSFLLARFAHLKKTDRVCDLGTGVGLLGILAIQRNGVRSVTGVEIQPELATLARENVQELGLEKKMEVWEMDWRKLSRRRPVPKFDVVLSNPPYRALQTGRLSPKHTKAIAKHEIQGDMKGLLQVVAKILKPSGRLYLLYPVLRFEELIQKLNTVEMKGQRIRFIHPFENRPATLVLVEAVRAKTRELKVENPLIVYRDTEHYTPEVEAWVGKLRPLTGPEYLR